MIKAATLMLIALAVLAMFGGLRLRIGRGIRRRLSRRKDCPDCGRPRIGSGPCDCRKLKG